MKVEIPKEIIGRLQKRVDESDGEFKNVEEYIEYILEQVVERLNTETESKKEEQTFSEEDEEKVKERLRALGYLD